MWCVGADGRPFSHTGSSCPTGSRPATIDEVVAGISGPTEAPTAGSYTPYQADTRKIGIYGGGRYSQQPGTVYSAIEDFKVMQVRDPAAYRKVVEKMRAAGIIGERVTSAAAIADGYELLLKASADAREAGQMRTPQQILDELASGQASLGKGAAAAGDGVGGYAGPRYTVELSSDTQAYTLLNDMARDLIGRDLSEQEIKKYTEKLRRKEAESPRVATPQGQAGTVYSGGIDRDEVVRSLISEHPEYAGYQLNHQIMDVMLQDIDEGQSFLNEWS
jgi:hypothetical protein